MISELFEDMFSSFTIYPPKSAFYNLLISEDIEPHSECAGQLRTAMPEEAAFQ